MLTYAARMLTYAILQVLIAAHYLLGALIWCCWVGDQDLALESRGGGGGQGGEEGGGGSGIEKKSRVFLLAQQRARERERQTDRQTERKREREREEVLKAPRSATKEATYPPLYEHKQVTLQVLELPDVEAGASPDLTVGLIDTRLQSL
jgi:hypothetical protein